MNKQPTHPNLKLVTRNFSNEVIHQQPEVHPIWEKHIRNLSASLTFLLDASKDKHLVALIGNGDEPSTEHAIRNWLRPSGPLD